MEPRTGFQIKTIILEGGERFPLMLDRLSGLPVGSTTDWSLSEHRGHPIATSRHKLAAVGMFYDWAAERDINLDARFGSLNLFSNRELPSLAEYLSRSRLAPSSGKSARNVVGATQRARIDSVIEYIKWRAGLVITALPVDHPKVIAANKRLEAVVIQLESLRQNSVSIARGSLDEEQCKELFDIVTPGSLRNPFQRRTQLRNYVLLLLLYELGIRRSEPLTIKGRHVSIGRPCTIRITFTPNDPVDPRIDTPTIKTRPRELPVSLELAKAYEQYLRERRSNPKTMQGAKRTEFVFLSTKDGKPMAKKSLDDIFVNLRENFPDIFPSDFAPHHLRRTWNYRFSMACEASGLEKDLTDKIHRYFMGWSVMSSQPSKYNEKFISEMAMKIGLAMQNKLTGDLNE